MKETLPNIFSYNDFRAYIADYKKALKKIDQSFTNSKICKNLGIPNTRSYLCNVINGRKVSPTFVERFIKVFQLDKDEAKFFRVLVNFNQAEHPEEKEIFFDQLIAQNRTPKKIIDKDTYKFFSNWRHSVVRTILDVIDFKGDYKSIATVVLPPISPKEACESIKLLQKLKLIRQDKNGFWRPSDKSITTTEYVKDEMIRQYQTQCLELAKTAILKKYNLPQNITTNIISVSSDDYKRIEKKLEKFRAEIRSLVHKDNQQSDCVYQMNIQLFPAARFNRRKHDK
jgi:uncharacterized protein (TIGR02147 family)